MGSFLRFGAFAFAGVWLLAACNDSDAFVGGNKETNYLAARNALETERYDKAITHYQRLLARLDGRPAARIRLEYSHALLRGNRFEEAIATAAPLTQSSEASIRAAAMAVRGTARHEQARAMMASGNRGAEVRAMLTGSRDDLTGFLRKHKKWDKAGSMQARLKLVRQDLAKL